MVGIRNMRLSWRGCLLSAVVLTAGTVPARAEQHYSWDFLTGHFDNLSLTPLGKGAVRLLKPAPDGLHVALPRGVQIGFVGFAPRFKIRGDFEVTLVYRILSWKAPESGYGLGPSLYVSIDAEQQPAAELGRVWRADGRSVYAAFAATPVDGQRQIRTRLFDADTLYGRLRLRRTGGVLEYAVADQFDGEFRTIQEFDFPADDIGLLRAGLKQSDPETPAEIVITRFSIRADELPHLPSEQARTERLYVPRYQPPPRPPARSWLWQAVAALVILAGAVAWCVRFRRR